MDRIRADRQPYAVPHSKHPQPIDIVKAVNRLVFKQEESVMTRTTQIVDTFVNQVEQPVNHSAPKRERAAYHANYKRKQRLAKASPERQLISRTKAILTANLREYGPRLATVLSKFEGELQRSK